jgi:hypothetical protein
MPCGLDAEDEARPGSIRSGTAWALHSTAWQSRARPGRAGARARLSGRAARRLDAGATYAAGIVLFLAGLALMVPSVVAIGGVLALLLALQLQLRIVEEPYLANTHRAASTAYVARGGRFVPGLGRQ